MKDAAQSQQLHMILHANAFSTTARLLHPGKCRVHRHNVLGPRTVTMACRMALAYLKVYSHDVKDWHPSTSNIQQDSLILVCALLE